MNLKNSMLKIIALFMAVSIVFGNCSLFCFGISKVIAEDVKVPELKIAVENSKYVQYSENEHQGIAIKSKLNIRQLTKEQYLPVDNIELAINMPNINGYYPQSVNVILASTKLTTGEENNINIKQNYKSDSGVLTLQYKNEQGYTNSNEIEKDEFEIIYIYPAEAYTGNETEIVLKYKINTNATFKTENGTVASQTENQIELTQKENKGGLLEFNTTKLLGDGKIYKGYLYSNEQNDASYNTEYETVSTLSILNAQNLSELKMELQENKFVKSDDKTEIKANGNIIYNFTKLNKLEFDKMLGQDGFIEFYNAEELVATVRYIEQEGQKKMAVIYSQEDIRIISDDNITVEYKEGVASVELKTSKPIAQGNINFINHNTIKPNKDYGMAVSKLKYIKQTTVVNEKSEETKILLVEPETKILANSSNVNFSTLQTNKTTIEIKLDDTNASAKLFNNPTIIIILPEGLTSGNLSSPEIVNGNGLTIESTLAKDNIITIQLEGKQTSYDIQNVSGGVSIVMDIENIKFKDTLPTHEDKIEVICKQQNKEYKTNCKVNILSKDGLLILSKTTGYDDKNSITTNIDSSVKQIEIDHQEEAKQISQTVTLVNNYNQDLTNVEIIGVIGYSNNEISSNFYTNLTSKIELSKDNAKVYYSANEQANAEDESWSEQYISNARLYKVVLEDKKLEKMDNLQIKINMQIPANLEDNKSTYIKTNVSYIYDGQNRNDNSTVGMLTNKNELTKFAVSTMKSNIQIKENNSIHMSIAPNITQNYVHSGQTVNYTVTVRNDNSYKLEDLELVYNVKQDIEVLVERVIQMGEAADYTELKENADAIVKTWYIEELNPGESKQFELILKIKEVSAATTKTDHIALYNKDDYSNVIQQVELIMAVKPKWVVVNLLTQNEQQIDYNYKAEEMVEYCILVGNYSNETLRDAMLEFNIPENLTYIEGGACKYESYKGYIIENYGELNENTFKYKIEKLKQNEEKTIVVRCKVNTLQSGFQENISAIANVYIEEEVYQSNSNNIYTVQPAYELTMQSNQQNETLKPGNKIEYTIQVKNVGKTSGLFNVVDNIPEIIEIEQIEYGIANDEDSKHTIQTSNRNISVTYDLKEQETLIIKITGTILKQGVEKDTIFNIENVANLVIEERNAKTSNIVIVKVEQKGTAQEPNTTETPNDPISEEKQDNKLFIISGIAWIDANKNGKYDENEKLQDSVIVSLMDAKTGKYVLDKNANKIKAQTDANGKYQFEGIEKGTYNAVFEFDINTYTVTTYKKEGVEEQLNSDAIITTATISNEKKVVGLTDKLQVSTANLENINIGLIENAIFDLSLNKDISKITVNNSQGTQEYTYKSGETAKVDLVAKYMNNTTVIVNYKFTITNSGDTVGYVNSLVDDIPSGLEFSSELNKDWYKGADGRLYTMALSGIAVKPGGTQQIELILTKDVTENNIGVFTNSATLEKITNLEGIAEKQEALDNNTSSAILFISIKTGSALLYIGITVICLAIVGAGAFLIKKKVLDRKI